MFNQLLKLWIRYGLLIVFTLISVGPFLWLFSTAMKSSSENIFAYPPQLIPSQPTLENFIQVWQVVPFALYLMNSFLVTGLAVIFNVIFSILAAYPLARFEFKGKHSLFLLILSTMMIPFPVMMIPLFMIVLKLHWTDSSGTLGGYLGQVIPFVVGGFGIFFVRQALTQIPKQLEESAILDGCNSFEILTRVHLPLIKPSLATLAVFTFMANWGEFLWPSIILTKQTMYTLPVGLVHLQGAFSANWRLIAAGTLLSVLPILIFFLLLQRYFVQGAMAGAVKG